MFHQRLREECQCYTMGGEGHLSVTLRVGIGIIMLHSWVDGHTKVMLLMVVECGSGRESLMLLQSGMV